MTYEVNKGPNSITVITSKVKEQTQPVSFRRWGKICLMCL